MLTGIKDKIFSVNDEKEFNKLSLEIFFYQYENCPVYHNYVDMICKDTSKINHFTQIPFLPIEFFKTQKVFTGKDPVETVFVSSGTTGSIKSHHYVSDLSIYEASAVKSFESFYGEISEYTFFALLPSYSDRNNSSLVWMTNLFMNRSNYKNDCGFYLVNHFELLRKLKKIKTDPSRKIILLGVSFALLDLAEKIDFSLNNVIVMETGGMKGKRKEIVREELHKILCDKFKVSVIHSEYGMTELLSQSYSQGNGIYKSPPWMKILIREINDPFSYVTTNKSGGVNVIDLANVNSCSFIETQDVGEMNNDGTFRISGRFDNSNIRGCNLMSL